MLRALCERASGIPFGWGAFALLETLARSETSQTNQVQPPVTPSQHDPSPIVSLPFAKTTNKSTLNWSHLSTILLSFWWLEDGSDGWPLPCAHDVHGAIGPTTSIHILALPLVIASATYLLSLQALGAAFCPLILLPIISENLGKSFKLGAVQKNVVLTRLGLGIFSVSLLLEGLAPTIPTLICGLLVGTLGPVHLLRYAP